MITCLSKQLHKIRDLLFLRFFNSQFPKNIYCVALALGINIFVHTFLYDDFSKIEKKNRLPIVARQPVQFNIMITYTKKSRTSTASTKRYAANGVNLIFDNNFKKNTIATMATTNAVTKPTAKKPKSEDDS